LIIDFLTPALLLAEFPHLASETTHHHSSTFLCPFSGGHVRLVGGFNPSEKYESQLG